MVRSDIQKFASRVAYARRQLGASPKVISAQSSLLLAACKSVGTDMFADAPAVLILDAGPEVLRRLPPTVHGMSLHQQLLDKDGSRQPNLGGALRAAMLPPAEHTSARAIVQARNAAQHPDSPLNPLADEFVPVHTGQYGCSASSNVGCNPNFSDSAPWHQLVHLANELWWMSQVTAAEVSRLHGDLQAARTDTEMLRDIEATHHLKLIAHVDNLKNDIKDAEFLVATLTDLGAAPVPPSPPSSSAGTLAQDSVLEAFRDVVPVITSAVSTAVSGEVMKKVSCVVTEGCSSLKTAVAQDIATLESVVASLDGKVVSYMKDLDKLVAENEASHGSFVTLDSMLGILKSVVPGLVNGAVAEATVAISSSVSTSVTKVVLDAVLSRLPLLHEAPLDNGEVNDVVRVAQVEASPASPIVARPSFLPDPLDPLVAPDKVKRFKIAPISQRGMASGSAKSPRPHGVHHRGRRSVSRPTLPAASRGKKDKG